ncbi:hypothetical protein KY362_08260, partial [Candidatus Woesearchaeota archaeon]|nr:hypothetical protein [Candidatus Woesearchaeota archaeon]
MEKKTRIQLIRPPVDDWYGGRALKEHIAIPTHLCLLASGIYIYGHSTEVIDGMYRPLGETKDRIDADWVGVTDIFAGHLSAMEILKTAKHRGAKTVVGGPNVTHLADQILRN